MDWYLLSVLVFLAVLGVIIYTDRDKFTRESILLLRKSQAGKGLLIRIGTRFPFGWKVFGFVAVITGFVVSIFMTKMLVDLLAKALTTAEAVPGLSLVLPSASPQASIQPGLFLIPFWYWIIALALLVLVHEGSHGIFAAREGVKIKSLGVGLLAVIPLAFVEPDEKQLEKKGVWPQLRVYSAGSFANFLLGGVTILTMFILLPSVYFFNGVGFGLASQPPYPVSQIGLASISGVAGQAVAGPDDIKAAIAYYGENDTLEIVTENDTFLLTKTLLEQQLNASRQQLIVFQDLPSARAGLKGVITEIDGMAIMDHNDLSLAMEDVGPGQDIVIKTRYGEEELEFELRTETLPDEPDYVPSDVIPVFAALEHVIPGSVDFHIGFAEWLLSLQGQSTVITWSYIQQQIGMWEYLSENYPGLRERAAMRIAGWEDKLDSHPRPGYLGISAVYTNVELKPGLEAYEEAIVFFQGLLFFLFLINVGVGAFNLLPGYPLLDGGKMWYVVLSRYVPRHAKRICTATSMVLLFIVFSLMLLPYLMQV